jgi:hypothetical protein
MGRGCVRSTSRCGYRKPEQVRVPHSSVCYTLRLVLRTQPRSGGIVKMRQN